MSEQMEPRNRGGPEKCMSPCADCQDGSHHFGESFGFKQDPTTDADSKDTGPNHPAALAGLEAWQNCTHCSAWREMLDSDDDDAGDCDFTDDFNPRDWV